MFCAKCGIKNEDEATACSACGEALKVQNVFDADKAKEHVTKTANDAWTVLKSLGLDPVGGLLQTYQSLGAVRALSVGVAFGLAFAVFFLLAAFRTSDEVHLLAQLTRTYGLSGFFKVLIVGFTPFLSLTTAYLIGVTVGNGKGALASKFFISGVSLLPLSIVFLFLAITGVFDPIVYLILFFVAICITVMILFSGVTRVEKLSDKVATYMVPLMLLASGWIAKIFLSFLFGLQF